ncbi:Penicillin-binding protein 4* [Anatilimnocola aggregata]|uniref:Penicillin-binding protein 4 n=1 Tax=Anatilimnocola aggregata TaxID=2528021 RepID=A0A517YKG8_9BACT|nr:serine hydrolase domain-containing protein [Anatilimnocola aggregata]QDU30723.1 Penicillin-binding protein 4* [Anatilimnocola aggregata]
MKHYILLLAAGLCFLQSATAAEPTGPATNVSLDQLFERFITEQEVAGCSVAITEQGRLVYARGFGWADVAARKPVEPTSLFRIASISKPITAVAILQLIEQRRLKLNSRVFDILEYEPLLLGDAKLDERQTKITIRHLLEHRGGWDRAKSFDGMFQSVRFADALKKPAPAKPDDIIRNMLGLPLDFEPGERYAYSNYGYCLLGRVIEKLSRQPYEEYVKEHVLAPLQIRTMRIGASHLEGRAKHEVRYYDSKESPSVIEATRGKPVPSPYGGFYLESLDSHGGWIASAVDLVRFASAFDAPQKCQILKPDSIRAMFARPEQIATDQSTSNSAETYYALGWNVRPIDGKLTTWHTGSLPGTATILIRRYDGLNIAVLFNGRTGIKTENLVRAIEGPLHQALDDVRDWPRKDYFPQFQRIPPEM